MSFCFRILALIGLLAASPALGQQIAFGGIKGDTKAPVEVTADSLAVNQETGHAVFTGNVVIVRAICA